MAGWLAGGDRLPARLKDLANEKQINHTVLSVDEPAGPSHYHVARDADVTVVLYTKHTVKANYSFKKGELGKKDIQHIVSDLPKILPEQQ